MTDRASSKSVSLQQQTPDEHKEPGTSGGTRRTLIYVVLGILLIITAIALVCSIAAFVDVRQLDEVAKLDPDVDRAPILDAKAGLLAAIAGLLGVLGLVPTLVFSAVEFERRDIEQKEVLEQLQIATSSLAEDARIENLVGRIRLLETGLAVQQAFREGHLDADSLKRHLEEINSLRSDLGRVSSVRNTTP